MQQLDNCFSADIVLTLNQKGEQSENIISQLSGKVVLQYKMTSYSGGGKINCHIVPIWPLFCITLNNFTCLTAWNRNVIRFPQPLQLLWSFFQLILIVEETASGLCCISQLLKCIVYNTVKMPILIYSLNRISIVCGTDKQRRGDTWY